MRFFIYFIYRAYMKSAVSTAWMIYSTVIAILLLLLFVLPGEMILNNTPLCESISKYNVECFACGMTRGFVHIARFEFTEAGMANRGSIFVFLFLVLNTVFLIIYMFKLKRSDKMIFVKRKQKWAKAV